MRPFFSSDRFIHTFVAYISNLQVVMFWFSAFSTNILSYLPNTWIFRPQIWTVQISRMSPLKPPFRLVGSTSRQNVTRKWVFVILFWVSKVAHVNEVAVHPHLQAFVSPRSWLSFNYLDFSSQKASGLSRINWTMTQVKWKPHDACDKAIKALFSGIWLRIGCKLPVAIMG